MQTQLVVTRVKAIAGLVTRVLAQPDLWNGVLKQLVVTWVKPLLDW